MKNKKLYHCNLCGKSFVVKDNLYNHLSKNKDCYDFYYRDKVENVDYVTCRICGKRLNNISRRHLKTHGMTTEEYKSKFSDAVLIAQETKEKMKQTFMKNYNCENPSQSDYIKKKKEQTFLKRYGVKNPFESEEVKDKIKQTCLKKYGVEYAMQSPKIKDKMQQTCLDRYGVSTPFEAEKVRNKFKQVCLEKYGAENPFAAEEVKDKMKRTFLERYGVEYSSQAKEVKDKIKHTCLERYGVKYAIQSKEVRDKIRQTNLEKYGVEYPLLSEEIQNKIRQTCLKKYGVEHPARSEEVQNKIRNTMKQRYGVYYGIMPRFSLSSQELFTSIELILSDIDPNIECFYATNKKIELGGKLVTNEYQVLVDSVSNDKKVRFLDFYIPELKKWIEFDESYHDSTDQLYDDKIREEEVRAVIPDIQLLRVKEEDYLNNKDYIIEKCINFILS